MSSTGTLKASGARHRPTSKIVILVQMILNLSLFYWMYEEYVNNQYFNAYVNEFFQAQGGILATLAGFLILGSVGALLLRRKRHAGKSIEIVYTGTKIATPLPTAAKKTLEPGSAFHAAVAALKADMASRPVVPGALPVSTSPEIKTTPTPIMGAAMMKIAEPPRSPALATSVTWEQSRPPLPTQVAPLLKTEGRQGPSVSVQPSSISAPTPAQVPTTVITGVVSSQQKKKEPEPPASEKSSS